MTDSSPGLIAILRAALDRLEEDTQVAPGDPAVARFKQRILRSIAQLEMQRNSLRAPDVIVPGASSGPSAKPTAASAAHEPITPDSVIVLVTRRPRKPGGEDGGGSGHSSAA